MNRDTSHIVVIRRTWRRKERDWLIHERRRVPFTIAPTLQGNLEALAAAMGKSLDECRFEVLPCSDGIHIYAYSGELTTEIGHLRHAGGIEAPEAIDHMRSYPAASLLHHFPQPWQKGWAPYQEPETAEDKRLRALAELYVRATYDRALGDRLLEFAGGVR